MHEDTPSDQLRQIDGLIAQAEARADEGSEAIDPMIEAIKVLASMVRRLVPVEAGGLGSAGTENPWSGPGFEDQPASERVGSAAGSREAERDG